MFEQQRIKDLQERIKSLKEENILLHKKNKELNDRITHMENIVYAAENYAAEHKEAMSMIEISRNRYEEALKELLLLRKQLLKQSK